MNLTPVPSPTGKPIIPTRWIPYFIAGASICTVLGAEFALPGPWTPDRYFVVGALILNTLVGGISQGLRR